MSDIKAHRVLSTTGEFGHVVEHVAGMYLVRLLDGGRVVSFNGDQLTWNPSGWPSDTPASALPQLPSRAEFIRDQLPDPATRSARRFSASSTFGTWWVVMDGFTPMSGEAYPRADLAEARAAYLNGRGHLSFSWVAEPTDTGVTHGPNEAMDECSVCFLPLRHEVHTARRVGDGSGHAFRIPSTTPVLGHRIPGTTRTV